MTPPLTWQQAALMVVTKPCKSSGSISRRAFSFRMAQVFSYSKPRASDFVNAFSLVELLIVVVLLGVAGSMAWAALAPHLRFPVLFERASRQIDDASRLQNLLESEVAEASSITYGSSVQAGCSAASSSLFTLKVPYSYDPATGRPLEVVTDYYLGGDGVVYRCGKGVGSDGSLDFASSTAEAGVASGLVIDLLPGSSSAYLQYRLTGEGLKPSLEAGIHTGSKVIR